MSALGNICFKSGIYSAGKAAAVLVIFFMDSNDNLFFLFPAIIMAKIVGTPGNTVGL